MNQIPATKPTMHRVNLTEQEQRALAWLLHATDNGEIISGADTKDVETLRGVQKRLRRSAS